MSEPIKAGDLVVVVRDNGCPCPIPDRIMGKVYTVASIEPERLLGCGCGRPTRRWTSAFIVNGEKRHEIGTYRLKRIPPLSELEGERTQEDIREPA